MTPDQKAESAHAAMVKYREAHAAALEEVERLNKAWKAQQFHLEAEERESAHWQERAEQAERRAERLKAHAEAMADVVEDYWNGNENERAMADALRELTDRVAAYRADKGE